MVVNSIRVGSVGQNEVLYMETMHASHGPRMAKRTGGDFSAFQIVSFP